MKRALAIAVATVLGASTAFADGQPHMRRALELLVEARAELESATRDKGGHRVKAIEHVDLALAQVREGIQFDNQH